MGAELLRVLSTVTIASSAALLLVGLVRSPVRAAVGARAAYWLWLLVPALMLASLLPAPVQIFYAATVSLPDPVRSALAFVTFPANLPRESAALTTALITVWGAGALAMFILLVLRQRSFMRTLGAMRPDTNGVHRSSNVAAPMLVGAWDPRIVVPHDFEARYTRLEQELILAHERAHQFRRDIAANAIASSWLCLSWFNPLVYWAMGWLRTDQELACDARVLAQNGDARHCYASALLKTQLATDSAWRIPAGCHWQSSHSLKERIVMLKRPLPGMRRQLVGILCIVALSASGGYAAWAAQAAAESKGPAVLVKMKVTATSFKADSKDTFSATTMYLVHSGETPPPMAALPYEFACTAFLPDEPGRTTSWEARKARGLPRPVAGQILLDCIVRHDGKLVGTPAVLAADGEPAAIETEDRAGNRKYKIELKATSSAERIASALKEAGKR